MDQRMKKLWLKDSSFRHCLFSNNPMPPTTFSKHIEWVRDENGPEEVTVYTDKHVHECNGGIGWLLEPRELIPWAYNYVAFNAHKFKWIWTHDEAFHKNIPNSILIPLGGCWIKEEDQRLHPKTKNFSIIASGKQQLEGHRLRHAVIQAAGNHIDVYGNGYNPIQDKITGLKDYRYHFAIENCRKDFWFTEKLIDCLVTGTIPIYWGFPSIQKVFNPEGFIVFDDLLDLKQKLKVCSPSHYQSKLSAVIENMDIAKEYVLAEDLIYRTLYAPKV
jgi:hypothetical protein